MMDIIIKEPQTIAELQIDSQRAFIPDRVIEFGVYYGIKEMPALGEVREYWRDERADRFFVHYIHKGVEYKNNYRRGAWVCGTDDLPCFQVEGRL